MKENSIIFTNDNCIGCNKCIKVCSAIGACISMDEERTKIVVDGSKCIACGSCIDVCVHGAREFKDDTEAFFADLMRGEEISLLLAPAFEANYPEEYDQVLGGLKALGAKRIINVSFGADITTWGYLNYIKEHDFKGGISQPCPAAVAYIERYIPELLPKLFPVQSPLMCAAIYARKELGITDKFAFISPCIAKKMEIENPENAGFVQYNVTFEHLMKYVREHKISGPSAKSEIEYGLGSFYPAPGGLTENVRWFLGDQVFIRQMEGERRLYHWLQKNKDRIRKEQTPFLFFDVLNCENGCICGTGVETKKSETDDALYALLHIREAVKHEEAGNAWSKPAAPEERLKQFNQQFAALDLKDYLRTYTDRSTECVFKHPEEEELEEIFLSMNKKTEDSRKIDCSCCGYDSCREMAEAIYNGFNHKENCIYYEKTMVHKLEVEKTLAEEETKAKNIFLANMSHEIRTPINVVLGMDEMILRESAEEQIRRYAFSIQRSGNSLLTLVNNVLDFSEMEAGKMELSAEKYDLQGLIYDLQERVRPGIKEKSLHFKMDIDPMIPRFLCGDFIRLKQCMMNILLNAIKYTKKGEVYFSVRLQEVREEQVLLQVRVRDTGVGIKKEDMERLFTAFERIDKTKNRTISGTGLGLNIVQRLLSMMDSGLEVESQYGKGSSFAFSVWQKILEQEPIGEMEDHVNIDSVTGKEKQKTFHAPHGEILMVDDTEMNLVVTGSLLKETRLRIDMATSGKEALAMIGRKTYDVLLLDHMMPEMDGIELLHKIREDKDNPNSTKPCIVLTANAVTGARERYINEGFNDYMSKPVNGRALELLLLKYLPPEKVTIVERKTPVEESGAEKEHSSSFEVQWYEALEGIDGDIGVKNCGSKEAYQAVLGIFYESIEPNIEEIEQYFKDNDWHSYTVKVHAMKSSAQIIGAIALGEMAQHLEDAGKAGNAAFIREQHERFVEGYRNYQDILKNLV